MNLEMRVTQGRASEEGSQTARDFPSSSGRALIYYYDSLRGALFILVGAPIIVRLDLLPTEVGPFLPGQH